jgi:hypothetical protein
MDIKNDTSVTARSLFSRLGVSTTFSDAALHDSELRMDMKNDTAVTAWSLFLYPSQHHAQSHESDLEEDYMEIDGVEPIEGSGGKFHSSSLYRHFY